MSLFSKIGTILITCGRGAAPCLGREVARLGFPVLAENPFGIEIKGTFEDTMSLNLNLRTAQRVLYRIARFTASDPREFYRNLNDLPWENYIDTGEYLSVSSVVETPSIRDSRFANLTAKDAIVDRLAAQCGQRPDSGPQRSGVVVHCYWKGRQCDVYFDTSGEPLFRRGYRLASVEAPLQESLAAALIMASGWTGTEHFVNPMCGSGTFAVEAALMALDKAPGLLRNNFGFMHVKGYKGSAWRQLRNARNREAGTSAAIRIVATDIDETAVQAARTNARAAGVESCIEFKVAPFQKTEIPEGNGMVVINPEYGKRLGDQRKLETVYRLMGDFLKHHCTGYRAAVFTGNLELAKHIGLRTSRKLVFFNGNIECRLLCYDLYAGSRKASQGWHYQ